MTDPFKIPSPFGQPSSTTGQSAINRPASFIEALRNQGQIPSRPPLDQWANQPTNFNLPQNTVSVQPQNPNQPFNFAEFLQQREQKIRQQERNLADQQRQSEKVLFHRKEEEARREVESIKEEIKKIIKTMGGLSAELIAAEQTVLSTTVEAGTYHLNFLQRVRRLLAIARKRLSESEHWLELFNSRQKQRSYYWGQIKKSGTKYMLSQERYMATQAG